MAAPDEKLQASIGFVRSCVAVVLRELPETDDDA